MGRDDTLEPADFMMPGTLFSISSQLPYADNYGVRLSSVGDVSVDGHPRRYGEEAAPVAVGCVGQELGHVRSLYEYDETVM